MRHLKNIAALLGPFVLSIQSASSPAFAENSGALPLTFGRCGAESKQWPRAADETVAGDRTFQSELLKCFGAELKRPVYALGDAAVPSGYFLDASIMAPKSSGGQTMVVMVLHHDNTNDSISLADDNLSIFGTPHQPDPDYYRQICREFSDTIRPKFQ
jgi:hypothetical protein